MKSLTVKILVALALLGVLPSAGCMSMHGATQVGGVENATWVYIQVNNERRNGVFRCVAPEGGRPACIRAEMSY